MIYGELALPLDYHGLGLLFETRQDVSLDTTAVYFIETSTMDLKEVKEQLEAETLELCYGF